MIFVVMLKPQIATTVGALGIQASFSAMLLRQSHDQF